MPSIGDSSTVRSNIFPSVRACGVQRESATRGKAEEHQLRIHVPDLHRGSKISKVIVELCGVVDVAAPASIAVATNIRRVDRDFLRTKRLCERMETAARCRRTMNCDNDLLGVGQTRVLPPMTERDLRAVAGRNSFDLGQITEIHAVERLADRSEGWRGGRLSRTQSWHQGRRRRWPTDRARRS